MTKTFEDDADTGAISTVRRSPPVAGETETVTAAKGLSIEERVADAWAEFWSAAGPSALIYQMVLENTVRNALRRALLPTSAATNRGEAVKLSAPIMIELLPREDGGVRVRSPDLPGLILSGANVPGVIGDIIPAVEGLREHIAALLPTSAATDREEAVANVEPHITPAGRAALPSPADTTPEPTQ